MIIVAITGASGVIYGIKLLKALKEIGKDTGLIISKPAQDILEYEENMVLDDLKKLSDYYYDINDWNAPINSGSFLFESMVIIPCTMKTLSDIANGHANNSITRAADVTLKEKRRLIIVPRETPLRTMHLENMLKISKENGIILPAMPGFYHKPKNIDDLTDFIAGKILDMLNIEHDLFKRWE